MNSTKSEIPEKSFVSSLLSFSITFVLMFAVWLLLSGNFSALMIGFGIVSSFLVSFFARDLIFPEDRVGNLLVFFRFTAYIPILHWEIVKSNFHLLRLVFHPNMMEMIDPHLIDFRTGLTSEISKVTLANSITLTPGTITVHVNARGNFKIHAIDRPSGKGLPGGLLKHVANIFGEPV